MTVIFCFTVVSKPPTLNLLANAFKFENTEENY